MDPSSRILLSGLGGQRPGTIGWRLRVNAGPIRSIAFHAVPAANRKHFEKCKQSTPDSATRQLRHPPCGAPQSGGTDRYASADCDYSVLPRIRNEGPCTDDTDCHPTVQRTQRNLNSHAGTQCAIPYEATTGSGNALGKTPKLPQTGLCSGCMKPQSWSALCKPPIWLVP